MKRVFLSLIFIPFLLRGQDSSMASTQMLEKLRLIEEAMMPSDYISDDSLVKILSSSSIDWAILNNRENDEKKIDDKILSQIMDNAHDAAKELIRRKHHLKQAYYYYGWMLQEGKDYSDAVFCYTLALQDHADPDSQPSISAIKSQRGQSKFFLQDYRGAIIDLTDAINNPDPILMGLTEWQNYYYRGVSYALLSMPYMALDDLNVVIENNPRNRVAYYQRALIYIGDGYTQKGCLDLSRAGELGYTRAYEAIQTYCNK